MSPRDCSTMVVDEEERSDSSTTSDGRLSPVGSLPSDVTEDLRLAPSRKRKSRVVVVNQEKTRFSSAVLGLLLSLGVSYFSSVFPHYIIPPQWVLSRLPQSPSSSIATATYLPAAFSYHSSLSHFDNTAWTYGTDYVLAVAMLCGLLRFWSLPSSPARNHGMGLLACYMVSVLCGGLAHQFIVTVEQQNSWLFRLLWTFCVGSVALASTMQGVIASYFDRRHLSLFWYVFGITTTLTVAMGFFSYQRPACDIFIVGTTQFPSTAYLILAASRYHYQIQSRLPVATIVAAFLLNAPLLPLYPVLVQCTHFSLGMINTILHTVLLISWSMQGWVLYTLLSPVKPPFAVIPTSKKVR
jgi:hypothetical protein